MFDFLKVLKAQDKKSGRVVYTPTFVIRSTIKDLMVRSGDFYAIFDDSTGLWVTEDSRAIEMIDEQLRQFATEDAGDAMQNELYAPIVRYIANTENHLIDNWHKFCKRDYASSPKTWRALDQKLIFSNQTPERKDFASKKLDYPLQEEPTPYYDKLCERLYLPTEQEKWEWFVGCIIAGDARKIQKMLVFYGEPGTGKSTIIGKVIAEQLLGDLATKFDANSLVGRGDFKTDFLENDSVLAYDDDAEMNMISSKTVLNKIISHESIRVNAKFKSPFYVEPNCLLIVGSNEPVQLSPNSGMNRRLIDIRPTGNKLAAVEYDDCIEHLPFERSGIAWKCLQTYKRLGRHYYDHYIAEDMLSRTSPFQNFVSENYLLLKDGISLANAYRLYTDYAESCKFKNILPRYKFRDTLRLYFQTYDNMKFDGFKPEKIGLHPVVVEESSTDISAGGWLQFNCSESLLDAEFADCPAQYETDDISHPLQYTWARCKTKLKDLDTSKIHYVKPPDSTFITMDFDIHGDDGEKSFEKNLEAANKFPPTYAELSKSGQGIHLEYIYTGGDPEELSRIFAPNVEVKVFTGGASLRRKLTKCNDIPIATIASGLPLREGAKVVNEEGFKNEKKLRNTILKAIRKEYDALPSTKQNVDFIDYILQEAYKSGQSYDVRDLKIKVWNFACKASNQSKYCMEVVNRMLFCSEDILKKEQKDEASVRQQEYDQRPVIFLDCEIFPSYAQAEKAGTEIPNDIPKDTPALFLVNWKLEGSDATVVRMINPTADDISKVINSYRIIGFNNRSYDNHMLWACSQGYTSEELYILSQRLIDKKTSMDAKFGQAYNISYTDVYDFSSDKKGLKKWEIELGINHLEWNHPWDLPVPKDEWVKVAEYCDNDVISTEAVFNHCHADFLAREILATLAAPYGGTVNTTTNQLTNMIVFEGKKNPGLIYTDFSTGKQYGPDEMFRIPVLNWEDYISLGDDWTGVEPVNSNHFPGYHLVRNEAGKLCNMYRGVDVGFGGYVYAVPGMYGRCVTKDVASMHPHSIKELNLFGDYTQNYVDLMQARIYIKHKEYKKAGKLFHGALAPYLENDKDAKALSKALKLALNSAYGLTSASFSNPMRDPRNLNNIVALRGALAMKTLQDEVEAAGFTVVHIKTDSIKIANPTNDILGFIDKFGEFYGYEYEVEHTWCKLCLVNNAVFIGRHDLDDPDYISDPEGSEKSYPDRWEAVGTQFQVQYVFKSLFSHQEIEFNDICQTISVKEGTLHLISKDEEGNEVDNFIGRVGRFCPMKEHGAELYRIKDGKRYAASGTKGYLWMEAETVKNRHLEDSIDHSYYRKLCDDAIATISQYGDFDIYVREE